MAGPDEEKVGQVGHFEAQADRDGRTRVYDQPEDGDAEDDEEPCVERVAGPPVGGEYEEGNGGQPQAGLRGQNQAEVDTLAVAGWLESVDYRAA